MVQSEARAGDNASVGHRRKLAEPSGSLPSSALDDEIVVRRTVGTRRRAESADTGRSIQTPAFSHAVPGSRRKIESIESDSMGIAIPAAVAARMPRTVGSRRRPEPGAVPVATEASATRVTASVAAVVEASRRPEALNNPSPAQSPRNYFTKNQEPTRVLNFLPKKRFIPAAGFSALVLASVAAFIDVSALPTAGEYKDVITAATVSNQASLVTSRDVERPPVVDTASALAEIEGSRFVTKETPVVADAAGNAVILASLSKGQTVRITGVKEGDWSQVIHKDLPRWIKSTALSVDKPALLAHEGEISSDPCARGSSIEARLQQDTIRVYRAVCERFPEIGQYWGQANRGTHSTGHSLDIMVAGARGHEVAAFLQDRQADLGIEYLIYEQRIWNIRQVGAGWRGMADRGGITANHYDHVHVTTFGNAGK